MTTPCRSLRCLNDHGVKVWHDGHVDLRDRRVQFKVAKALRASRSIVVYVGPTFRNSVWCKAEYMPGLRIEIEGQLTRVLVAMHDRRLKPPEELRHCPIFDVENTGILAARLLASNKLPFSADSVSSNIPAIDIVEVQDLTAGRELNGTMAFSHDTDDRNPTDVIDHIVLDICRDLKNHATSDQFSPLLCSIRDCLVQRPVLLPSVTDIVGKLLRGLCLAFCNSPEL